MDIKAHIAQLLREALVKLNIDYDGDLVVDYPADLSRGDFAVPLALKLGKELGRKPRELAEELVEAITDSLPESIATVEAVSPGFINFTLSPVYWARLKEDISSATENWGSNQRLSGQTYLIEHSSPNLFKPFHLGHVVNNCVGASLNRLAQAQGAVTHLVSFPSDVSPGIAKAVWGLMDLGMSEDFTVEDMGEAYTHGVRHYQEDEEAQEAINTINLQLYTQEIGPALEVFTRGLKLSYDYFETITQRLGSVFERYFPESECEREGKEIVKAHTGSVFLPSQGAIIFPGSRYGLFDNIFINSQGFGTYLCKDIGLLSLKFKTYNFNHSVTITDIEQKQHFQLVKKAAEQIVPTWSEQSTYIHHGRLTLTSGKISSREGGVPLAVDLLDSLRDRVLKKMKRRALTAPELIAEEVAQAALKYAILKTATGKNIVFDFDKDLSFEGTSGPYIQYTYVRAQSAIAQAEKLPVSHSEGPILRAGETPEVERLLVRFPDTVERAWDDSSPHHVAVYLYDLASAFNTWYAQTKIADPDNPDLAVNLALTRAVAQTLQNGLSLLGIKTVEEM